MAGILHKAQEAVNQATTSMKGLSAGPGERIVSGHACYATGCEVKPFEYVARALAPDEVEIAIESCGVCHTDIAAMDNQFGQTKYPFVPGHEIVGRVTARGSMVSTLKIGQRCGVGWFRRVCGTCEMCHGGHENLCPKAEATILNGNNGGWADAIRVQARMAVPIPDELPSEASAVLMCAGITVFTPLVEHGIIEMAKQRQVTVGLLGMGGLGHLFVKFAAALGCRVVVFSSSSEKEPDARALGAAQFVSVDDRRTMGELEEKLDLLLSTVYETADWSVYLKMIKPLGKMCLVGWTPLSKPIAIPPFDLIYRSRTVCGSNVGSVADMKLMLDFCAKHNILPELESGQMRDLPNLLDRFRKHPREIRYRMVVSNPSKMEH